MVRILKFEDAPRIPIYDEKGYKQEIIDEKCGAKEIGGVFFVRWAGASGKYHYHRKREKVWFVLSGTAKILVEGIQYEVGSNTMIFIAPGEKHKLTNISSTDLQILEFFSHPEDWPFIEVPECTFV